jgi:hypothetical protein
LRTSARPFATLSAHARRSVECRRFCNQTSCSGSIDSACSVDDLHEIQRLCG